MQRGGREADSPTHHPWFSQELLLLHKPPHWGLVGEEGHRGIGSGWGKQHPVTPEQRERLGSRSTPFLV